MDGEGEEEEKERTRSGFTFAGPPCFCCFLGGMFESMRVP